MDFLPHPLFCTAVGERIQFSVNERNFPWQHYPAISLPAHAAGNSMQGKQSLKAVACILATPI